MDDLIEIKNLENCYSVYKLTCKNTPNVSYIGITNETYVIGRLFRHFMESVANDRTKNEEKHAWIRDNWKNINMDILEDKIPSKHEAERKEAKYIFECLKNKENVLNKTYVAISLFDINGNLYKSYPSYQVAAEELNVKPCRLMQAVNRKERLLGIYTVKKYDPDIKFIKLDYIHDKPYNYRKILQYDLDGNLIKEWESGHICSKELNIDRSLLTKCLKDFNKTANSYRFKYKNESILDDGIQYRVFMYNSDHQFIAKFRTAVECSKYLVQNNYTTIKESSIQSKISTCIKNRTLYLKHYFTNEPVEDWS